MVRRITFENLGLHTAWKSAVIKLNEGMLQRTHKEIANSRIETGLVNGKCKTL